MDRVSSASGLLITKAMAANDVIAERFARESAAAGQPDAVLNGAFQVLDVAQEAIDAFMEPALKPGVGERLDVRA